MQNIIRIILNRKVTSEIFWKGTLVCLVFIYVHSTSTGICEFCTPQEAEVSGASPDRLCVTEAQSGAEVVRVQRLFTINRIVSCGIMGAAHPDLFF